MARHPFTCPVRWADLNASGQLNAGAFVDYLQEARVHFLLTGPPVMASLLETGVLVVSHQVEYLQPVFQNDQPLRIELWVASVGAARFRLAYLLHAGDDLVARAHTVATPFDLRSQALRRLDAEERAFLLRFAEETEPLPEVAGPAATEPIQAATDHRYAFSVRWSDLDSYGHANNVKLYDYLQEARIALLGPVVESGPGAGWLLARQDVRYLKPVEFRLAPYEVRTATAGPRTSSCTLVTRLLDPDTGDLFATGSAVVVRTDGAGRPTAMSADAAARLRSFCRVQPTVGGRTAG